MDDLRPVGTENGHGAGVRRAFCEDQVPWVDRRVCGEAECLLRASGDHHLFGVRGDALHGHEVHNVPAQLWDAIAGAVLERRCSQPGGDPVGVVGELFERQLSQVRGAVRK
jgi:hypothetical protein